MTNMENSFKDCSGNQKSQHHQTLGLWFKTPWRTKEAELIVNKAGLQGIKDTKVKQKHLNVT